MDSTISVEANESTSDILKSVPRSVLPAADAAAKSKLPTSTDYYFYKNFKDFSRPLATIQDRITSLLAKFEGYDADEPPEDVEETFQVVSELVDTQLDLADASLEAHERPTAEPTAQKRSSTLTSGLRQGKIPEHVASCPRPQEKFDPPPDNSNNAFQLPPPVGGDKEWLLTSTSRAHCAIEQHAKRMGLVGVHPLAAQLTALSYSEDQLAAPETPQLPRELESTPLTWVDTPLLLDKLAATLRDEAEIAVDLESHHYRSFQGFTCLMQISTRQEDFLVDVIALRAELRDALGATFQNPAVTKVMHGADSDVVWLQRDFGIYVVNMFDTGQAARALEYPYCGLAFVLQHLCAVKTDKRYQLADWRVRPLSEEMMHYARTDTHHLLYIYDRMRDLLGERAKEGKPGIQVVLNRSRDICMRTYEKELLTETSYLDFYKKCDVKLTEEQLAVLAGLFSWRDKTSRRLDESTGYVMSKAVMLRLVERSPLPCAVSEVAALCRGAAPIVELCVHEVIEAIRQSREQHALAVPLPAAPPCPSVHTRLSSEELQTAQEGSTKDAQSKALASAAPSAPEASPPASAGEGDGAGSGEVKPAALGADVEPGRRKRRAVMMGQAQVAGGSVMSTLMEGSSAVVGAPSTATPVQTTSGSQIPQMPVPAVEPAMAADTPAAAGGTKRRRVMMMNTKAAGGSVLGTMVGTAAAEGTGGGVYQAVAGEPCAVEEEGQGGDTAMGALAEPVDAHMDGVLDASKCNVLAAAPESAPLPITTAVDPVDPMDGSDIEEALARAAAQRILGDIQLPHDLRPAQITEESKERCSLAKSASVDAAQSAQPPAAPPVKRANKEEMFGEFVSLRGQSETSKRLEASAPQRESLEPSGRGEQAVSLAVAYKMPNSKKRKKSAAQAEIDPSDGGTVATATGHPLDLKQKGNAKGRGGVSTPTSPAPGREASTESFDYVAAREAAPFGSGFGIFSGAGKDAKRKGGKGGKGGKDSRQNAKGKGKGWYDPEALNMPEAHHLEDSGIKPGKRSGVRMLPFLSPLMYAL
eukprot:gene852-1344_t